MQLSGIRPGDVVRVDKKGRRFFALAMPGERTAGMLPVRPVDERISYRSATAREVVGHWRASKATQARGALAEMR